MKNLLLWGLMALIVIILGGVRFGSALRAGGCRYPGIVACDRDGDGMADECCRVEEVVEVTNENSSGEWGQTLHEAG